MTGRLKLSIITETYYRDTLGHLGKELMEKQSRPAALRRLWSTRQLWNSIVVILIGLGILFRVF